MFLVFIVGLCITMPNFFTATRAVGLDSIEIQRNTRQEMLFISSDNGFVTLTLDPNIYQDYALDEHHQKLYRLESFYTPEARKYKLFSTHDLDRLLTLAKTVVHSLTTCISAELKIFLSFSLSNLFAKHETSDQREFFVDCNEHHVNLGISLVDFLLKQDPNFAKIKYVCRSTDKEAVYTESRSGVRVVYNRIGANFYLLVEKVMTCRV